MNAIDTNILVYCHDIRDPKKQRRAVEVVNQVRPLALLWQVGCEFISAARKLSPSGFSIQDAWDALADAQQFASVVATPKPDVWWTARDLQARIGFSYWDALVVSACLHAGVKTLYSEDLAPFSGRAGLSIVDPLFDALISAPRGG